MKIKTKEYFKWLFTRWYFYVIFIFLFLNNYVQQGYGLSQIIIDLEREPFWVLGSFLGGLLSTTIIISIFYFLIRKIKQKKLRYPVDDS